MNLNKSSDKNVVRIGGKIKMADGEREMYFSIIWQKINIYLKRMSQGHLGGSVGVEHLT